MKRFTVLLLVLSLFVTSASALGNSTPAQPAPAPAAASDAPFDLDAAFEAGSVALVETDHAGIEVSADAVELPDAMWAALGIDKPDDPAAYAADALAASAPVLMSLSPAGNSGLFELGGAPIAWYDGVFRPLYPNVSRGVEDKYGNLQYFFRGEFRKLLNDEGVVYSHSGRYAFIPNIRTALIVSRFAIDPTIIDLSTGEVFLLDTYADDFMDDPACVTAACFSADDRYFCYALYGNGPSPDQLNRTGIYRCDLETRSISLLASNSDFNYWPNLCETAGGSYIILRDALRNEDHTGITLIRAFAGKYVCDEKYFDVAHGYWSARSLLYSADSGYAVVVGQTAAIGVTSAFQCFRPEDGYAGLNTYYTVEAGGKIAGRTGSDFEALLAETQQGSGAAPSLTLLCARLSPDGRYALIFAGNSMERHLLLVRLEDMTAVDVAGIDPAAIRPGVLGGSYKPTIEWNNDNLIIETDSGIRTFRMASPAQ